MRIALAGNPNCGKTTIFNQLTGRRERVGNWAGVTIESKEAPLRRRFSFDTDVTIIDLPGTYSLDAYTLDEQHAIDYIKQQKIDCIINIVDASNLERNLYLTTELQALNIPLVVALNKSDIVTRRKTTIDLNLLEELLGCEVFLVTATRNKGLRDVIHAAIKKGALNYCDRKEQGNQSRKQKRKGKRHCH
ncbi:MAG: FeoB small GTPase domain-containing protein [Candidatus Izemoplasmataceae bacterium]